MNQISNIVLVSSSEDISLDLPSDQTCPSKLEILEDILDQLNPDIHYNDRIRVGAAIFNETQGSLAGYALFAEWCGRSAKCKGVAESFRKWKSFKLDHPNPAKLGTLFHVLESEGVSWKKYRLAHTPLLAKMTGSVENEL